MTRKRPGPRAATRKSFELRLVRVRKPKLKVALEAGKGSRVGKVLPNWVDERHLTW